MSLRGVVLIDETVLQSLSFGGASTAVDEICSGRVDEGVGGGQGPEDGEVEDCSVWVSGWMGWDFWGVTYGSKDRPTRRSRVRCRHFWRSGILRFCRWVGGLLRAERAGRG